MLIEFDVNFRQSIWILFVLKRGEGLDNVVFCKQGTARNSHDLHGWASKFEVVINDSYETVFDDGNINMNKYGIVTHSTEKFNSEVLLDPFEKQIDLPPVFIKQSDVLGGKAEIVRVISYRSMQVWNIVDDMSVLAWILLLVMLHREDNGLMCCRSLIKAFSPQRIMSIWEMFFYNLLNARRE